MFFELHCDTLLNAITMAVYKISEQIRTFHSNESKTMLNVTEHGVTSFCKNSNHCKSH